MLLHAFVMGADREDNTVARVRFTNHAGVHQAGAKAFVDASSDGDLAFFAGASTRDGNSGAVNPGTPGTRFGGGTPGADGSAAAVTAEIRKARARGAAPIGKDRSVMVRLPLSGEVVRVCPLASAASRRRGRHWTSARVFPYDRSQRSKNAGPPPPGPGKRSVREE